MNFFFFLYDVLHEFQLTIFVTLHAYFMPYTLEAMVLLQ
jgi:hypothetical protein